MLRSVKGTITSLVVAVVLLESQKCMSTGVVEVGPHGQVNSLTHSAPRKQLHLVRSEAPLDRRTDKAHVEPNWEQHSAIKQRARGRQGSPREAVEDIKQLNLEFRRNGQKDKKDKQGKDEPHSEENEAEEDVVETEDENATDENATEDDASAMNDIKEEETKVKEGKVSKALHITKRVFIVIAIVGCLLLCLAFFRKKGQQKRTKRGGQDDPFHLRVFAVSDLYTLDNLPRVGRYMQDSQSRTEGGVDGAADLTLLTMGGDMLGGCLQFFLDKGVSTVGMMNLLGFDFSCLGNHEFDNSLAELAKRVVEFKGKAWLNSNILVIKQKDVDKFNAKKREICGKVGDMEANWSKEAEENGLVPQELFELEEGEVARVMNSMPKHYILEIPLNKRGQTPGGATREREVAVFRLGFMGLCAESSGDLTAEDAKGCVFQSEVATARQLLDPHRDGPLSPKHCDAVIALTHMCDEEDQILLERFPHIRLVLGGHEHVKWKCERQAPSYGIATKTGQDATNLDVIDVHLRSGGGCVDEKHTAHPADSSDCFSIQRHECVKLVDSANPAFSYPVDAALAEAALDYKKMYALPNFTLLKWNTFPSAEPTLRAEARQSADPSSTRPKLVPDELSLWHQRHGESQGDQSRAWTTTKCRERQVNFCSLISRWTRKWFVYLPEEEDEGPDSSRLLFLMNSGTMRNNVDYGLERQTLTLTDLKQEFAFNAVLTKVVLKASEIRALLEHSERFCRGSGAYIQYDPNLIKLTISTNASSEVSEVKIDEFFPYDSDPNQRIPYVGNEDKEFSCIVVAKVLEGMDDIPVFVEAGKKLGKKKVKALIESGVRQCDIIVHQLLRRTLRRMDKFAWLMNHFRGKVPGGRRLTTSPLAPSVDSQNFGRLDFNKLCDLWKEAFEIGVTTEAFDEECAKEVFEFLDINDDGEVKMDEIRFCLKNPRQKGSLISTWSCR